MEIWLDSINTALIRKAKEMGILKGVTTNPSLLSKTKDPWDKIKEILDTQDGPVTAQVVANGAQEMISQGEKFYELSPRIIVKVPVTQEGLKAIRYLSQKNIDTMATVVFHHHQVLLAASAGAKYAAPYLSHMIKSEPNGIDQLHSMIKMRERYAFQTKILVASIHSIGQISICLDMGVDAITLKDPLFLEMTKDQELTLQRLEVFATDWEESQTVKK